MAGFSCHDSGIFGAFFYVKEMLTFTLHCFLIIIIVIMSDKIPGQFISAHKALKLETAEDQENLIKLLLKYSLPAIEKARAKRKWTRKQELINFAIVEL